MKYVRLIAFLFTSFLLISITSAEFEDDFQNHPSNDEEQYYDGYGELWDCTSVGGYCYLNTVTETYNRALHLSPPGDGSISTVINAYGDDTDYFSYVTTYTKSGTPIDYGTITLYDIYGVQLISFSSYTDLQYYNSDIKYEYLVSSGNLYVYANGVLIRNIGMVADNPAYWKFNAQGRYAPAASVSWYIDRFSTDGYDIGIGTDESPDTWINTASNNEIDVEWTVKTIDPYGTWNDTEVYQIITTWIDTGTIVNITTLNTTIGAKPNGFVVYNRTLLMPEPNYGTYRFDLVKDGVTKESDYLTFWPIGESGTLSWDQANYVPYDTASITYQYGAFDSTLYDYYIKTYEINTGLVNTQTVTSISDTIEISLDAWDTGSYYSLLSRVTKADSTEIFLAYDVFNVNDEVKFTGLTYDAENGIILNSTNVNFTQSTTWYNTTSSATTASYNLTGLSDLVQITLNASKTNFTHEAFTFTPPTSKLYTTNLYLFPTNRSLSGTSIVEGMTVDYPLHQGVGSATVNIYNATWSNTTTSNAFGYYQFNLSELENGTYTVNATLSGYDNSSEYSITVTENQSTVQNIVLDRNYVLTVKAADSSNGAYLSTFTATVDGVSSTVTDGDATFSLEWGLYSVSVTASGYYAGSTNVLLDSNETVTVSMVREESPYYDPSHYVKFTVQNIWGRKYSNVEANVYVGSLTTALFTNSTGSDGAVAFELDEDVLYRITFINSSQSISETITIYPVETSYKIYINSFNLGPGDTISDEISYGVSSSRINSSHGYINLTWIDTGAATTNIQYWINDTGGNVVYSTSGSPNMTNSQIVDANNDTYIVHVIGTHPTHGTIDYVRTVVIRAGRMIDMGWDEDWHYGVAALIAIIFIGMLFGAATVQYGAVISVLSAWFFMWVGWFTASNTSYILLILATVVAIGFAMRKGEVVRS